MTRNQTIFLGAIQMANALSKDDNLKDLEPQAAVNQLCKYLDTTIVAAKERADYYQDQYGIDLSAGGSGGSEFPVSPELLTKVADIAGKFIPQS